MRRTGLGMTVAGMAIAVAAIGGCGASDDEGKEQARKPASAEQVGAGASLSKIRGHQLVSVRLYGSGRSGQAAKHAGHPVEEVYATIAPDLRAADPSLARRLKPSLVRPERLIEGAAAEARLQSTYEGSWALLDEAERALVPADVREGAAYQAQVIASLLESVEEEYGEAIESGKVSDELEYQDAWGFLSEAQRRFDAARDGFGDEAEEIAEQLDGLRKELPSVTAPAAPVAADEVEQTVKRATTELAEISGTVAESSDPAAEASETAELLEKARSEYGEGERAEATELVAEAYLEHFEKVEQPLAERDEELMEQLEVLIATTLRNKIKSGAPRGEVNALVDRAVAKLEQAERLLRQGT